MSAKIYFGVNENGTAVHLCVCEREREKRKEGVCVACTGSIKEERARVPC